MDQNVHDLFEAVLRNDLDQVRRLVAQGADPNAPDPHDAFPDGTTPLTDAAAAGLVEMTTLLIHLGADVNAKSAGGWTPLMRACNAGQIQTAQLLLEAGADPKIVNTEGYNAYGRISASNPALMRLLEKWGGA